ncbi:MAG: chromosome segregation protein SMC [Anaerolineae bacterium]|nr:chromosome segregation protein SMC [Anaerolineae bacterium]
MTPRLKSLEMQGYKTFASRTLLEYPAQITAVVGPNGAGKSNVADAIRWVLGEQSYSLLRGRKTEDMIFAGSEQRARASMASASITFNNEDNWLPIDFSEVSITRRAYRDGQNEYLLNGQRVRLKEISELLAQSGLAERTYTIIGQGLVDSALSLKPDERRRFFEEAAGIGLFRSRREEALTRLDNTRRNLDRVLDILSELEPRLQSLERQARKAQEYERIKADLQVLLRDWYGYHWHRVQNMLAHSKETLRVQESRLEQARLKLAGVEDNLGSLRAKLQLLRDNLNGWHAESAGYHQQSEKVSRELAILEERQRSIVEQCNSLQAELTRLEEDYRFRQQKLQTLAEECARLQSEFETAQEQAKLADVSLRQRTEERNRVEAVLQGMRHQLVQAETSQVRLKARQQELLSRIDNLQRSFEAAKTSLEKETAAFGDLEARSRRSERLAEEAQAAVEEAEGELQKLRSRREEISTRRKEAQDSISRLEGETSKIAAQLQVLEQAEKAFTGLNQGARFLLESAQKGNLKGKYVPLSAMLDVPAEYEKAIASVLGEYLDGVILDRDADPENAMVLLEAEEKGRAVLFLPLEADHATPPKIPANSKILGRASDLVKAPKNIKNLITHLLGNVVLVNDRKAAYSILDELPETVCVVTLRGEVFYRGGVVIAGQDNRAAVIARPRQKRELRDRLEELDRALETAVQSQKELDRQIETLSADEQKIIKELNLLNQRMRDSQKASQQAKLEVEQARQRMGWHKNQASEVEGQLAKGREELEKATTAISEESQKIELLSSKVKAQSRRLLDLPLDELQAQVAHWNTNAAVARQAVMSAEARLAEHEQSLKDSQVRKQSIKERLEGLEAQLQELERLRAALRVEETALNQKIDSARRMIEPAEKELESIEAAYNATLENQAATQQAVMVAERHAAQAQLEFTRQREELTSLRSKIEDDFGLVSYEYTTDIAGQEPLPLGSMVAELPALAEIPADLEENINRQRSLLRRMGAVNPDALNEYQAVQERYLFLKNQVEDLEKADTDLRRVIGELDELMRREFKKTFDAVAVEFRQMFTRLFGGGSARLLLTDEENPTDAGIDIEARLPGRREQGLSLLSGGERSLTAVALIFSLLKISPTPFCVLDEVDAMLDEANVGRFCELLSELSKTTQFIVITHNRNTVQTAGVIYGVTMGRDSASQLISLRLDELSEEMVG